MNISTWCRIHGVTVKQVRSLVFFKAGGQVALTQNPVTRDWECSEEDTPAALVELTRWLNHLRALQLQKEAGAMVVEEKSLALPEHRLAVGQKPMGLSSFMSQALPAFTQLQTQLALQKQQMAYMIERMDAMGATVHAYFERQAGHITAKLQEVQTVVVENAAAVVDNSNRIYENLNPKYIPPPPLPEATDLRYPQVTKAQSLDLNIGYGEQALFPEPLFRDLGLYVYGIPLEQKVDHRGRDIDYRMQEPLQSLMKRHKVPGTQAVEVAVLYRIVGRFMQWCEQHSIACTYTERYWALAPDDVDLSDPPQPYPPRRAYRSHHRQAHCHTSTSSISMIDPKYKKRGRDTEDTDTDRDTV